MEMEEEMSRMESKLTALTITELKEELKERQMKVGGIKKELVKRLAKRLEEEEEEEEEEEKREEERKEKFWIDDERHTKKMKSFNSWDEKAEVNVQQWLKLFNFKCDQKGIPEHWKVDHLSEYLEGKALQFYIDCLMKDKVWKSIEDKIILHFGRQEEDQLTRFLNLKLHEMENLEPYFREKSQLAQQLGFQGKQTISALTQGIELEELRKLMIATSPTSLEKWKEIAILLAEATSRKPAPKPAQTDRQPARLNQERPPWPPRRNLPATPCRTCANLGVENALHFQEQCINRRTFTPAQSSGLSPHLNNPISHSRRSQWNNTTPKSSGHQTAK